MKYCAVDEPAGLRARPSCCAVAAPDRSRPLARGECQPPEPAPRRAMQNCRRARSPRASGVGCGIVSLNPAHRADDFIEPAGMEDVLVEVVRRAVIAEVQAVDVAAQAEQMSCRATARTGNRRCLPSHAAGSRVHALADDPLRLARVVPHQSNAVAAIDDLRLGAREHCLRTRRASSGRRSFRLGRIDCRCAFASQPGGEKARSGEMTGVRSGRRWIDSSVEANGRGARQGRNEVRAHQHRREWRTPRRGFRSACSREGQAKRIPSANSHWLCAARAVFVSPAALRTSPHTKLGLLSRCV